MPVARVVPGRVSPVNRRLTLLSGALVATLALSSCGAAGGGGDDAVVARVNGHELTSKELRTLAEESTAGEDLRTALGFWIRVVAVLDDPTGAASPETAEQLTQDALAIVGVGNTESGRAQYELGISGSPIFCLRVIPLEPGLPGQDVIDEMAAGLTFADAAAKYSTDETFAQTAGLLANEGRECFDGAFLQQALPGLFQTLLESEAVVGTPVVLAFEDADVIALLRPYDELPITDRVPLAEAEVSEVLRTEYYEPSEVFVDSRYGVWDPSTGQVIPYSVEE
jgi:hypothetical protein